LEHLKTLFPDGNLKELTSAADNATTTDDAVETFLNATISAPKPESEGTSKPKTFKSIEELLENYRYDLETEPFVLHVGRTEIWRVALGFYKKALNNPKLLWKSFEVFKNLFFYLY